MTDVQKFGIENTKKLLKFVFDVTKQASSSLKDGWQWTDAVSFFDEAVQLPGAIKSIPQVKNEITELSTEERADLLAYFKEEFDIPDDKVEERIEKGIEIGLSILALVEAWKGDKAA